MIILTISAIAVFIWLLFQAIKLSLKVAWGLVKIVAYALCIIALPLLIVIIVSAGGFLLLLPIILVAIACGLLETSA